MLQLFERNKFAALYLRSAFRDRFKVALLGPSLIEFSVCEIFQRLLVVAKFAAEFVGN